MALAIEAAELMEHFQWLTTEASRQLADDPAKLAEVGDELADVIGYSFALANEASSGVLGSASVTKASANLLAVGVGAGVALGFLGVGLFVVTQATTSGFEVFFIRTILGTDGYIEVPDEPGLGVEVDEAVVRKYAFE